MDVTTAGGWESPFVLVSSLLVGGRYHCWWVGVTIFHGCVSPLLVCVSPLLVGGPHHRCWVGVTIVGWVYITIVGGYHKRWWVGVTIISGWVLPLLVHMSPRL